MKRWYVIQVYAGYEAAVKAEIERRVQEESLQEFFGEIMVPSAKTRTYFDAVDTLKDQQLFPGYMVIELEPTPQAFKIVTTCPRVIRFLGGAQPSPLSQKEVDRIIGQMKGDVAVPVEKHDLEMGKEIEISEGPFAGFNGIIDAIDEEAEKVVVMVSIFGRMTPVELQFNQIKQ